MLRERPEQRAQHFGRLAIEETREASAFNVPIAIGVRAPHLEGRGIGLGGEHHVAKTDAQRCVEPEQDQACALHCLTSTYFRCRRLCLTTQEKTSVEFRSFLGADTLDRPHDMRSVWNIAPVGGVRGRNA